ncbi:MAG TPA: PilN domain-containing protein [Nevskiaceae bacterium]|nr:PilN domain-containing protein [Nevskiaceae bacterium]
MRINLLDWRQARRDLRKKQFLTLLGLGAGAALALVLFGYFIASQAVQHQNARNDYLRAQIAETDQKIAEIQDLEKTRANLLARMRVIEELQASRSATVHFFDEIVNTLPDGVSITSLRQAGANVTITGVAESTGRISTYLKNLDASTWFADPKLIEIKTFEKDKQRKAEFTLQVRNLTKAGNKKTQENAQ